jgi:hypothetical protein
VPLQEDANVIGPLPPGLYKVAAEAQEAGCSILTKPIPLVGATQRRHTAWLPINWLWQRKAAQSPMGRQRQPQSALNGPCCPVEDFNVPLQPRGLAATRNGLTTTLLWKLSSYFALLETGIRHAQETSDPIPC